MGKPHPLQSWFISSGVQLHSDLYLEQDPVTGLSFYTSSPLSADTIIIRVPSDLCITTHSAFTYIQQLFSYSEAKLDKDRLPAADWILLYLILCRLAEEYSNSVTQEEKEKVEKLCRHIPYVSHIPKVIETPLHFSPEELSLLTNTPLVGSTERRLRETVVDYDRARNVLLPYLETDKFGGYVKEQLESISQQNLEEDPLMHTRFHRGLELWRWAESAFTSRSFPARLAGLKEDDVTPILIPAYDTFNHARAKPVTWSYEQAGGVVCMTLNYQPEGKDVQVWNNYGGKSNEEFLSSYGFTLNTMSEDTLALRLGGEGKTHYWLIPSSSNTEKHLEGDTINGFRKSICPCPSLLKELQNLVLQGDDTPTQDQEKLELYGEVLETLEQLLLSKRKAFRASQKHLDSLDITFIQEEHLNERWHRTNVNPSATTNTSRIRNAVYTNIMQYRSGQLHLLNHAVDWTRNELGRVAEALDHIEEQE